MSHIIIIIIIVNITLDSVKKGAPKREKNDYLSLLESENSTFSATGSVKKSDVPSQK